MGRTARARRRRVLPDDAASDVGRIAQRVNYMSTSVSRRAFVARPPEMYEARQLRNRFSSGMTTGLLT